MQNFGRFCTTSDLIANISGTGQEIENRKHSWSRAIPPAFDEKGPANLVHYLRRIPCEFGPTKMDFLGEYIFRPLEGASNSNFYTS